MNDGFNWLMAALFTVGLAFGMMLGLFIGSAAAKWTIAGTLVFTFIAIVKTIYTPVRGVEDDQE